MHITSANINAIVATKLFSRKNILRYMLFSTKRRSSNAAFALNYFTSKDLCRSTWIHMLNWTKRFHVPFVNENLFLKRIWIFILKGYMNHAIRCHVCFVKKSTSAPKYYRTIYWDISKRNLLIVNYAPKNFVLLVRNLDIWEVILEKCLISVISVANSSICCVTFAYTNDYICKLIVPAFLV